MRGFGAEPSPLGGIMLDESMPLMMCEICHEPLVPVQSLLGMIAVHREAADHPPLAVPQIDEVANCICDVCGSRSDLPWLVLCTPFTIPNAFRDGNYTDDGEWGLCDDCGPLAEEEDWAGLLQRAIEPCPANARWIRELLLALQANMLVACRDEY